VESDHLWHRTFVEVAANRVAHLFVQLQLCFRFCEDGFAQGARREPALWFMSYHEDDFFHRASIRQPIRRNPTRAQ